MSDDEGKPEHLGGDSSCHQPLPYIVRIRVTVDEDSVPELREYKVTAYSALEAIYQSVFQAGGQVFGGDTKYVVDSIEPDLVAFMRGVTSRKIRAIY